MVKYIFVTGGVVSSLGKGLASASIGCLLESRGYRVTIMKFDPYLNVDPGTMSPFQHGEVFVTDDGTETDLDLGHYERFTSSLTTRDHNWTTGRIYEAVINKERKGDYLGKTVQVIPHVTNEIKQAARNVAKDVDFVIVEIGGTVGDIEGLPFLEAVRQMRHEVGKANAMFIHLTLVPFIAAAGELKTKPTQHSVKELRAIGIQPDVLLCRTDRFLSKELKAKIALFCNVEERDVITAKDVDSIYEVPLVLSKEGLDHALFRHLEMIPPDKDMSPWINLVDRIKNPTDHVDIFVVGKYTGYEDSYKSLNEALVHGGIPDRLKVNIHWFDAETLEGTEDTSKLRDADGILVPGGFGTRGIEGKLRAIRYAREEYVPYFGICLGMQCAVIEFARSVCGLDRSNSTEFDQEAPHRLFAKLKELEGVESFGGNMRLGSYPCELRDGTLARKVYGLAEIRERHRHRYEFNREFEGTLRDKGMIVSGISPDGRFVEMMELQNHPYFLGCQFHPEFKSKPLAPHPLFRDFVRAAYQNRQKRQGH
ncbi:MAG: CTP synthase [Acidobacteriota bacterium]